MPRFTTRLQSSQTRVYETILSSTPKFLPHGSVKSLDWFKMMYQDRSYRVAFNRMFVEMYGRLHSKYSCALTRVIYRWQLNSEDFFYTRNPTPGKPRRAIYVNDLCPLYKRRVAKGYMRAPSDYHWKHHMDCIEDARRRNGF